MPAYAVTTNGTELLPASRLFAVESDGSNVKLLSERDALFARGLALYGGGVIDWLPGECGAVLMGRYAVAEFSEKSRLGSDNKGLGVVRVDTLTGYAKAVEKPRPNAVE